MTDEQPPTLSLNWSELDTKHFYISNAAALISPTDFSKDFGSFYLQVKPLKKLWLLKLPSASYSERLLAIVEQLRAIADEIERTASVE